MKITTFVIDVIKDKFTVCSFTILITEYTQPVIILANNKINRNIIKLLIQNASPATLKRAQCVGEH